MGIKTATVTAIETHGGVISRIQFTCDSTFRFDGGQFVSILVPSASGYVKRLYSLASSPDSVKTSGYELCVKKVHGGLGSTYLTQLSPGDQFKLQGAFGDFKFKTNRKRPVIFIGTGSGIAPLRSIASSTEFNQEEIPFSMAILGFRSAAEIPYYGEFEKLGIATRYAVSQESSEKPFIRSGRVTQILQQLKPHFSWCDCDYYLCGNPDMIAEVREILAQKKVSDDAIFYESFAAVSTYEEEQSKAA